MISVILKVGRQKTNEWQILGHTNQDSICGDYHNRQNGMRNDWEEYLLGTDVLFQSNTKNVGTGGSKERASHQMAEPPN